MRARARAHARCVDSGGVWEHAGARARGRAGALMRTRLNECAGACVSARVRVRVRVRVRLVHIGCDDMVAFCRECERNRATDAIRGACDHHEAA